MKTKEAARKYLEQGTEESRNCVLNDFIAFLAKEIGVTVKNRNCRKTGSILAVYREMHERWLAFIKRIDKSNTVMTALFLASLALVEDGKILILGHYLDEYPDEHLRKDIIVCLDAIDQSKEVIKGIQ